MSAKTATLRPRGRLSDAEREQRRAAEREFVQQAVEALRSSDGWQRWLASRRHFHSYCSGTSSSWPTTGPLHTASFAGTR